MLMYGTGRDRPGLVMSVAHTSLYELLHIRQLPIRALVLAMVGLKLKQED